MIARNCIHTITKSTYTQSGEIYMKSISKIHEIGICNIYESGTFFHIHFIYEMNMHDIYV